MIDIDTSISCGSHLIRHTFSAAQNRVVLFGVSGSGKSVLLKMIAGFINPDHGKIAIGSHILLDTSQQIDIPVFRRRIGYLPQEYTLFPNLNVIDNDPGGQPPHLFF